ncbi:hypothetical protein BSKO_00472 [Bryopsis sp. KO-2023]|nr:hypothetical protein BSKO_00472 [Bryopsis sp. KO-2023]
MFPLPTHQRRRSFQGPPGGGFGPHGAIDTTVDEEPGAPLSPRRPLQYTRRFPVPLRWDLYWDDYQDVRLDDRNGTFRVYTAGSSGPVVLCLHGGGYTALTWSLAAQLLKDRYRVVGLDMRGHGDTVTSDDGDLSAETLCADTVSIWTKMFGSTQEATPTVIVGHSMGGAIAVRAAASHSITSLEGVVVIDVVEGTALGSLPHMLTLLKQRPPSFPSQEAAVEWALSTRMSRNEEAACISLPNMLKPSPDGTGYVWRTLLKESEQFWRGWFTGLSDMFLAIEKPKMLVLVGTDRLDKALTIGQMQGRFQMVVLPAAGHAVQEDESEDVAETVGTFMKRFRIGQELPAFVRR